MLKWSTSFVQYASWWIGGDDFGIHYSTRLEIYISEMFVVCVDGQVVHDGDDFA